MNGTVIIRENSVLENVIDMYNRRVVKSVHGEDTEENEMELEILYVLYTNMIKSLEHNDYELSDDIVTAWLLIQAHRSLIELRSLKRPEYVEKFDKVANNMFIKICTE